MSKSVKDTLEEMLGILKQGQMTEGQKIYFSDSVVTQEGNQPPVVGKQAAIERLDKFRETIGVAAFVSYTIGAVAISGNTSFYDSVLTVKLKNGETINLEQVVKTDWQDGKIVKERDDLMSATRYAIMMLRIAKGQAREPVNDRYRRRSSSGEGSWLTQ